jgi:hypothetical protein
MIKSVGHMDRGERTKALISATPRLMMKGTRFHQGFRKAPQSEKIGADFGVAGTQLTLFRRHQRKTFFLDHGQYTAVRLAHVDHQHQLAEVMKQSGNEGVIGGFLFNILL